MAAAVRRIRCVRRVAPSRRGLPLRLAPAGHDHGRPRDSPSGARDAHRWPAVPLVVALGVPRDLARDSWPGLHPAGKGAVQPVRAGVGAMTELLPPDPEIRQFYRVHQPRNPDPFHGQAWEWEPRTRTWFGAGGYRKSPRWAWIDGWRLVGVADPQPVTDRRYYITAVDAGRTAFLAGPYPTHAAALAQVDAVRRRTEESYPFAVFWSFGTASLEGPPAKTWLGEFSG